MNLGGTRRSGRRSEVELVVVGCVMIIYMYICNAAGFVALLSILPALSFLEMSALPACPQDCSCIAPACISGPSSRPPDRTFARPMLCAACCPC